MTVWEYADRHPWLLCALVLWTAFVAMEVSKGRR